MITAVGGGILRDVLLNNVRVLLQKRNYASAALAGAGVVVIGNYFKWVIVYFWPVFNSVLRYAC